MNGRPDEQRDDRPEAEKLHRPQPLIMVERDGHVVHALLGLHEDRVGRHRADRVHARGAGLLDRRLDLLDLLASEETALAGVRD